MSKWVDVKRGVSEGKKLIDSAMYEHIARRVLLGMSITDIGKAVGVSRVTMARILENPEFVRIYRRVQQKVYKRVDDVMLDERFDLGSRIQAAAPRALTKLIERMENSKSEVVQKDAAVHILGLAGKTPIQKKLVAELPVMELPVEQQKGIANAMAEAMMNEEIEVVDAEVVDENSK